MIPFLYYAVTRKSCFFLLIFKEEKHRHELWRHNDIKCAASLFPAKTPLFLSRRRVLIYILEIKILPEKLIILS